MTLIPRQERFCHAFVHYGTATTAARTAGYAPRSSKRQGWRLLRSPRIQARIREIQAGLADHQGRADAAIIGKLEVVYRRALEDHQFHAAARAAQLQGQFMRRRGRDLEGDTDVRPSAPDATPEMDTSGTLSCPESQKSSQKYPWPDASVGAGLRAGGRGG